MKILLKSNNKLLHDKMLSYKETSDIQIGFANTDKETIYIMENYDFDAVILELKSVDDLNLLNHINEFHKNTRVILLLKNMTYDKFIDRIEKNKYSLIENQFDFSSLDKILNVKG